MGKRYGYYICVWITGMSLGYGIGYGYSYRCGYRVWGWFMSLNYVYEL